MSDVVVTYERVIDAAPARVYEFLVDYNVTHRRILPKNFLDFQVEEGGVGTGTVVSYRFRVGRRERSYRMRIEADPTSHVIVEQDLESSLSTRWDLTPGAAGGTTRVRLRTVWLGASGIGGFFERTFAPPALRGVYADELERLAQAMAAS